LIVEVQNLQELQSALGLEGITRILCDNFNTADLALAAGLSEGKMPLEASGNIDENNILCKTAQASP
ncbi:MAG: hypothetical protein HAW58_02380, partial [Candidatus Thioglobus sp.]|nr:hypothetical protein [Candidatus Thioglobus sp.]